MIQLLAEEFSGHSDVFFLRADVDDCSEGAAEYGIEVLPSILIIKVSKLTQF